MIDAPETARIDANQRGLVAALARVRRHLERWADPPAKGGQPGSVGGTEPAGGSGAPPAALARLCEAFGLSDFERDVLLLCAGVELEASFADLVGSIQDGAKAPTFGLALAALPGAHWSALTPGGALRRWRLVDVGAGEQLVASALHIDERVLHHLAGLRVRDDHLAGFVEHVPPASGHMAPSRRAVIEAMTGAWAGASRPPPVLQVVGPGWTGKRAVAAEVAARAGMSLYVMPWHVIPTTPHELDVLMRLWEREAVLGRSALLIEAEDPAAVDGDRAPHLRHFLERTRAPLLVAARERLTMPQRASIPFELRKPTPEEQRVLWTTLLGDRAAGVNGQVDRLTGHFDLSASSIEAACRAALSGAGRDGDDLGARLWAACRSQARPRLGDLAEPLEPVARWDDLVLPELQTRMLREVAVHVRQRATVHERWGFAARSARGLGIGALFAGPSGTGKTLAAEVLAGSLALDLYRIDLSRVVSKYIGETEKNLARVFDAAEEGGAILLFDEADALFGKRSEVRDSHDRYANIEVSYLLQRMEAYRGLAILTTNLKSALDEAFLRRLRFVVTFPFPAVGQRREIWRRVFPPETPTEGLDVDKLARLNIAGGNIRNIAVSAAFLAADGGGPVRMEHVLRAARTEYAKLERPLTDAEIRGWT